MPRFTTISPRLLASAVTVAAACGLLAAPGAAAAGRSSAVTDTKVAPSPGFASTGVHTDACDDTTAPGWIGTTAPTLSAAADSAAIRFAVWDGADKIFDQQAPTGPDGTAQVTPTGLADGHSYTWKAWPEYQPGSGKPSAECHLQVDTTAPALAVNSTDFPATGTATKYAGQTGTFSFTGTDQGSGVACYEYVLNGTPSAVWNCQSPNAVPADADGGAVLQLKPRQWGPNTLTVVAMDNAGNVSQPVNYNFNAPSNPNPPKAPGDVDGDGVPDILLPDAAGNLQIISGDATSTTPDSVLAATVSPSQQGWQNNQLSHLGWDLTHAPVDDIFDHPAGASALYLYRNTNLGAFASSPVLVNRPAGAPTADWSATDQLVALGALGATQQPSLLTLEQGNLWLFTNPGFAYRYRTVQRLSTTGAWAGYDLLAPGNNADGSLSLWARNRATGELRTYSIPKTATGYDFSALADPAAGTVVGSFPIAAYPTLGTAGPNLYAVTADRHLLSFTGYSEPRDLGTLH